MKWNYYKEKGPNAIKYEINDSGLVKFYAYDINGEVQCFKISADTILDIAIKSSSKQLKI